MSNETEYIRGFIFVIGAVSILAVAGLVYITSVLVNFIGALRFDMPELIKAPPKKKEDTRPESSSAFVYDDAYAASVEDATSKDIGGLNQTELENILRGRQ